MRSRDDAVGARRAAPVAVLVALVAAVALPLLGASPAAASSARLQGTVTTGGAGAVGVQVQLLNPDWGSTFATATTTATGGYGLTTFPGTYKVRFHDPTGALADTYAGGASTFAAAPTLVLGSGTTTTVDAAMVAGATITGHVTGAGAAPLGAILVEAIDLDGHVEARTTTAGTGAYQLHGLPAGSHDLRFTDPAGTWARTYDAGSRLRTGATAVPVAAGATATADQQLARAGTLTGRATIGSRGQPAPGLLVVAVDAAQLEAIGVATTAADGSWSMPGLGPGPTKVAVVDAAFLHDRTTGLRPVMLPAIDIVDATFNGAYAAAASYAVTSATVVPTPDVVVMGNDCDPSTFHDGANLTNRPLAGADLRGCDLDGAAFELSSLSGADLRDANLTGARFGLVASFLAYPSLSLVYAFGAAAQLDGVQLRGADLAGALLTTPQLLSADADLRGTDLTGTSDLTFPAGASVGPASCPSCVAPYVDPRVELSALDLTSPPRQLAGARFTQTSFAGSNLAGLDLSGLSCTSCAFNDAQLDGARITGADLTSTSLKGADLTGVVGLVPGQLEAAGHDLTGTKLPGLDLHGVNAAGWALAGADLTGTDLAGGTLQGSNLTGATVTGADLTATTVRAVTLANATGLTTPQLLATGADWTQLDLTGTGVDLSGADLRPRTLTSAKLVGLHLAGADLALVSAAGVDLSTADLTGASLAGANLLTATLAGATLTGADLTGTTVRTASFAGATGLSRAAVLSAGHDWTATRFDGTGVDLTNVDFTAGGYALDGVDLAGLDLAGSRMAGLVVSGAKLGGADLTGADLAGTSLVNSDLRAGKLAGADLSGAGVAGADLTGATGLTRSSLLAAQHDWTATKLGGTGVGLTNVDFTAGGYLLALVDATGLDLSGSTLTGRDLHGAVLTNAKLTNASLAGANLSSARMTGAELTGTVLTGANLTWVDLRWRNLSGRDLTGATLTNALLDGTNVTGATLAGAVVTGTRFTNAVGLTRAQLASANPVWGGIKLAGTGVDLSGFDFTVGGYNVAGAGFEGLDLSLADLQGRKLNLTWFVGTNLSGANLKAVSAPSSNLSSANLTGADLSGGVLTNAKLAGANLTNAVLTGLTGSPTGGSTVIYSSTTCPDGVVTNGTTVTTCVGHGLSA